MGLIVQVDTVRGGAGDGYTGLMKSGGIIRQPMKRKLKSKITLDLFMHLLVQTRPRQPFELTSSAVTVGGVCIYV